MKTNPITTFYIVRHGETDWNVKKLIQGQENIPLNKRGYLQREELNKNLRNVKFDLIFSSDLERAAKTVELIALERKLAVQTTKKLREKDFGRLSGKSVASLNEFRDIFNALSLEERLKYKYYPDVESDEETIARIITFLRELAISYPQKTILTPRTEVLCILF